MQQACAARLTNGGNNLSQEVKIALRQARAAKVAEFNFQQRMDKIEWEETVLKPYLEELAQRVALNGEIPVIELDHED